MRIKHGSEQNIHSSQRKTEYFDIENVSLFPVVRWVTWSDFWKGMSLDQGNIDSAKGIKLEI